MTRGYHVDPGEAHAVPPHAEWNPRRPVPSNLFHPYLNTVLNVQTFMLSFAGRDRDITPCVSDLNAFVENAGFCWTDPPFGSGIGVANVAPRTTVIRRMHARRAAVISQKPEA